MVRDQAGCVKVTVNTPTGCKQITAKQVVVGFPPTKEKMSPFDTTTEENDLFSKWACTKLFNGLIKIDGLTNGTDLQPVSSDPARYYVPQAPNARYINLPTTPYTLTYVVGNSDFETEDAKKFLAQHLETINEAGSFAVSTTPEYFGFADHSPTLCSVPEQDATAGFWSDIVALQGKKDTWYVGQAFAADLTAYVWAQAQGIVDQVATKL